MRPSPPPSPTSGRSGRGAAPSGIGLTTFDDSHLDPASADSFMDGFFAEAGGRIRGCLGLPGGAASQ